jgi:hypothetical protein
VKYRNCADDQVTTTLISNLEAFDNGDGTFTVNICVRQGSTYAEPVCVQNSVEVTCDPYTWVAGGNCSTTADCGSAYSVSIISIFPTDTCDICYDSRSQVENSSDYTNTNTICLDLSNGTFISSTQVTIAYSANVRPKKFNLLVNDVITQTSGWRGTDNSYSGPWGGPGDVNTNESGTITFTYSNTNTYKINVEVGPINPEAPVYDAFEYNVNCPTKIAPSVTPTKTPAPTPINREGLCRGNNFSNIWYFQETSTFGDSRESCANGILGRSTNNRYTPSGTYTNNQIGSWVGEYQPTTKTLNDLTLDLNGVFINGGAFSYYGFLELHVRDCSNYNNVYILDRFTILGGKPRRVYQTNQITNLPTPLTYNGTGYWLNDNRPYNRARARVSTTNNVCAQSLTTGTIVVYFNESCFDTNTIVYTNPQRTTILTGFNFIEINNRVFQINSTTGVVGSRTTTNCGSTPTDP